MEKLEVDSFEIDLETLSTGFYHHSFIAMEKARIAVTEAVIAHLTQDSKKRFEEYQEQNNPCR